MRRRAGIVAAAALSLLAATTPVHAGPDGNNALVQRVTAELRSFTDWLQANGARGFIGEVGWPAEQPRWNEVAGAWFALADRAGLDVTVWATGEQWPDSYRLALYEDRLPGAGVDSAAPAANVVEAHATRSSYRRGVNVAGGEFGAPAADPTSGFSNTAPGVYGRDYQYDSHATFDYLAGRGVEIVRIPFRWERLQRAPGAPLDPGELERLRLAVRGAGAAGLEVILDMHNFGAYYLSDGAKGVRRPIGSPEVTVYDFAEMWGRISNHFRGESAVLGYGLMNEPVGLPSLEGASPAEVWERASQAALDRIRANGDRKLVLVGGYEWSGVQTWAQNHPYAWVDDPANNFRYEAHHYFDGDHSGTYARSWADEALSSARGTAVVKVRTRFGL